MSLQLNTYSDSGFKPGLLLPGGIALATGNAAHLAIAGGLDVAFNVRGGLQQPVKHTSSAIVPTLVIAGRFDVPVGSLDPGLEILKSINGSEYAIMNGSGHFPYDEEPERYQQVIADFSRRRLDPPA